jgi:hypothetical protein
MNADPTAVANAAIADLQTAINNLSGIKDKPGADEDSIDDQIDALEEKQVALTNLVLKLAVNSAANKAAIQAVNDAAADLKTEAANITAVATALDTAQKVVNFAATLITALGAFA